MNYCNHALWQSLQTFPFGTDTDSFSARLARENRWSAEFTGRVIDEYRKFLFLCGVSGEHLAPSKAVDEAWHLHLIYTRSYWKDLCGGVLGRELHHNPGADSEEGKQELKHQYDRTLLLYRTWFGEEAPADIWPQRHTAKLGDNPAVRMKKRAGTLIVLPASALLLFAALMGTADAVLTAVIIMVIIGVFGWAIFLLAKSAKGSKREGRKKRRIGGNDMDAGGVGITFFGVGSESSDSSGESDGGDGGDSGCSSGCSSCGGGCGGD